MNTAHLTSSINDMLQHMESHFAKAKAAMGIRPNLANAKVHAQEAHLAIEELGALILHAKLAGILAPPDVMQRINTTHDEVDDLIQEIMVCDAVQTAGDARRPRPVTGKDASN